MGSAGTLAQVVVQGESMDASKPLECCVAAEPCWHVHVMSQRDTGQL